MRPAASPKPKPPPTEAEVAVRAMVEGETWQRHVVPALRRKREVWYRAMAAGTKDQFESRQAVIRVINLLLDDPVKELTFGDPGPPGPE